MTYCRSAGELFSLLKINPIGIEAGSSGLNQSEAVLQAGAFDFIAKQALN